MPNKLKKLRINSKKQIERLFKQPFLLEYPFKGHYLIEDGRGEMHCLIAVSHKQYKKAVDRNRIKRVVRAVMFELMDDINLILKDKNKDLYIALIYIGDKKINYKLIKEKIIVFLQRLLNYENNKENTCNATIDND